MLYYEKCRAGAYATLQRKSPKMRAEYGLDTIYSMPGILHTRQGPDQASLINNRLKLGRSLVVREIFNIYIYIYICGSGAS